ncbi:hypothetical protein XENORESO_007672, partial [Xenotaenia resolanae]
MCPYSETNKILSLVDDAILAFPCMALCLEYQNQLYLSGCFKEQRSSFLLNSAVRASLFLLRSRYRYPGWAGPWSWYPSFQGMHMSVREIHFSPPSDLSYFLRVDWEGRNLGLGFQLLLTDGQKAWRGKVSEVVLNDEAEELEMPKEKYIQDLQQALTEPENSASYCFTVKPDPTSSCTVTLTYEKMQKDIS